MKWSRSAVWTYRSWNALSRPRRRPPRPRPPDPGLVGLLDVAAPLLVHAGEHVGLGQRRAVGATSGTWKLWRGCRRRSRPRVRAGAASRAAAARTTTRAPTGSRRERREVVEAAYGGIGDAVLDLRRRPASGDHRRAHPDRERALRLEVPGHRHQPGAEVVGRPVDHRALGEVGQRARQSGELRDGIGRCSTSPAPTRSRRRTSPATPPATRASPPPTRRLQEAHRRLRPHERQVLLRADRPHAEFVGHPVDGYRAPIRASEVRGAPAPSLETSRPARSSLIAPGFEAPRPVLFVGSPRTSTSPSSAGLTARR